MREPPGAYRFVIHWPVGREDIPGVAARLVRELHGRAPNVLVCDLTSAHPPGAVDAVAVDALARLALAARRCRWTLRLDDVPAELSELITMMGLTSVLLAADPNEVDG